MNKWLLLFLEFFKTGLFSVGGGLATLPFLYEISDKTGWFSHADIADMIAISESTPGAIGINMSTYAGYQTAGILGGIEASLALALPSFIVILVVAAFLDRFKENRYVESAFYGLRPASIAMISAAGLNVVKIAIINIPAFLEGYDPSKLIIWKGLILAVVLFAARRRLKLHPVFFIAVSAVIGIVFRFAGV
ncbi:MAG: chromate transporter [Lachnospiraceae bacterium]|nr:chromate transporter [Lachnospiraceae bacterium]